MQKALRTIVALWYQMAIFDEIFYMNILLLGSGGREHALAWKLSQSPLCNHLYIAPGNGGTKQCGENIPLAIDDFEGIYHFILQHSVKMVIVGPEAPLVTGIQDYLNEKKIPNLIIVGPSAKAALLEGSKSFAKAFMKEFDIPTAAYEAFTLNQLEKAYNFLEKLSPPYVLKADGLAAGKGVLIIDTLEEAKSQLHQMLSGKFGQASKVVVVEEFLSGIEFSVFVLTDGVNYVLLPEAKDYKRIGEGDTGLNTGGMGAISPVPFVDAELMNKVTKRVIDPTIRGIKSRNLDYKGFIFFGLINVKGEPKLIEYNCRLGDPETEAILPRIDNDLVQLLLDMGQNKLNPESVNINKEYCATVMLVSGGYPGNYQKGKVIRSIPAKSSSLIFHAGTIDEDGRLLTNGGRVIAVSSLGKDLSESLSLSYENADRISFEGKYFRRDIGFDL